MRTHVGMNVGMSEVVVMGVAVGAKAGVAVRYDT